MCLKQLKAKNTLVLLVFGTYFKPCSYNKVSEDIFGFKTMELSSRRVLSTEAEDRGGILHMLEKPNSIIAFNYYSFKIFPHS